MESDNDDASFLSMVKKRPRLETTAAKSKLALSRNVVLSIPSSSSDDDDDDDDDDVATLRASQSFAGNGGDCDDDDATIDKLHETQEIPPSMPWSPLTASPFTPHDALTKQSKGRRRASDIRNISRTYDMETIPCDDGVSAAKNARQGLNLSKVRQSSDTNQKENAAIPRVSNGSLAEHPPLNSSNNPNVVNKTTAVAAMTTKKSVLESTVMLMKSPPAPQISQEIKPVPSSLPTNAPTNDFNRNDTRGRRPKKDEKPITSVSVPTKASNENVKTSAKKHSKMTHPTPAKESSTTSIDSSSSSSSNNNIKGVGKKTKTCTTEFTKPKSNEETVTEPKLSNKKSETSTKQRNENPIAHTKNMPQSTVKADDAKSTTSSKVTTAKPKKKLTFQEQVMVHMLNALKPFTLKQLSEELKTSESSVNFVLLSLVDKGLVVPKDFASGKNGRVKTLYWANHDAKAKEVKVGGGRSEEALASHDERDAAHRHMVELRNEIAMVRNRFQQVIQTPSNDDLTQHISKQEGELQELWRSREEIKERIRAATTGSTVPSKTRGFQPSSGPKCPIRIRKRINQYRDEWMQRKRKCMDFVEQLADGLEKKPKDVIHLCDIDTDEMQQVVPPAKYPMG